jgi:PAS domain S-box-containing protein
MGTQQEFLEAIRNDSADAIVGLDAFKKIIFWNKGAENIFGYGADEILQKPFQMLVPAAMIGNGQLRRIFSQVNKADFVKNYEINLKAKDDRNVAVDLTLTAIHDENDNHIGISAVIRDISERKLLEEKVLQTERLATVGRMAAKVAHDIRNPLSSISLNAELLGDEISTFSAKRTNEANSLLKSIASEVDRLTQISDEYLQFSRTPKMKFKLDDINLILTDLIKLLSKELLAKKIRVLKRFSKLLPLLPLDKAQMQRAFLNLLRNAVEAMPKGGTIKLITRSDSEYVTVRIIDTGEGICEKELSKIFDPFHSTKEYGTGLGLTITRQIIEEHGGSIKCKSRMNECTEFEVQLPLKEIKKGDIL